MVVSQGNTFAHLKPHLGFCSTMIFPYLNFVVKGLSYRSICPYITFTFMNTQAVYVTEKVVIERAVAIEPHTRPLWCQASNAKKFI
jgi:hypothetical protein